MHMPDWVGGDTPLWGLKQQPDTNQPWSGAAGETVHTNPSLSLAGTWSVNRGVPFCKKKMCVSLTDTACQRHISRTLRGVFEVRHFWQGIFVKNTQPAHPWGRLFSTQKAPWKVCKAQKIWETLFGVPRTRMGGWGDTSLARVSASKVPFRISTCHLLIFFENFPNGCCTVLPIPGY